MGTMLQVNGKDERIRVWRLQGSLVKASVATGARAGDELQRRGRRQPGKGYDRP
jgi:hypothetical protein